MTHDGDAFRRFAVAAGLASVSLLASCSPRGGGSTGLETVVINGETFQLEVVNDNHGRENGLKHRTSIPDHGGMLFVFPDSGVAVQSFWMHECLVDMDIIYLDPRGRVTATHHMLAMPPKGTDESEEQYKDRMREQSYSSAYPAQFAIELQAGSLERLNVKFEQKIELDIPRLKAAAR